VAGNLTLTQLSAGYSHACGVTPEGRAYCWGDNHYGELGDGTTTQRLAPVAVANPM
jgi:alpha-tubulin suppressor-like RCC1 family protein